MQSKTCLPMREPNSNSLPTRDIVVLNTAYQLTDSRSDLRTCSILATDRIGPPPTVGAYNQGLIMIVDDFSSKNLLASWSWLLGTQCLAFMITGFGDVFFWKPDVGVHFLEVQRAEIEFIDSEIQWFMQEFLIDPNIIDQVLRTEYFKTLVYNYTPLNYGEIFVLEPWLMLGGDDKPQNYDICKFSVYLDLVGQTHRQSR